MNDLAAQMRQALDQAETHDDRAAALGQAIMGLIETVNLLMEDGKDRSRLLDKLFAEMERIDRVVAPTAQFSERLARLEEQTRAMRKAAEVAARIAEDVARTATARADRADELNRLAFIDLRQAIETLSKQQTAATAALSKQIADGTPALSMKDVGRGWWILVAAAIAGVVGWFTDWLRPR